MSVCILMQGDLTIQADLTEGFCINQKEKKIEDLIRVAKFSSPKAEIVFIPLPHIYSHVEYIWLALVSSFCSPPHSHSVC